MSEPSRFFGGPCAATLLVATITGFSASVAGAAENRRADDSRRYADERIPIEHARVARASHTSAAKKRPSLVAQAAEGRTLRELPEAPLDGSLVQGSARVSSARVSQAGFLEHYGAAACGPDCGCARCAAEPACGIAVGCGVEPGFAPEPGCGLEPGCGVDPGWGFEPGCGLGAAIEMYGPGCRDGCDCADCCETTCGVDGLYLDHHGCGIEAIGDCSCDACCGDEFGHVPVFLPYLRMNWHRYEFIAGVQGFKGPLNFANTNSNIRNGSGSFGFYQGFNEGRSLRRWCGWDMAAQFGVRATQSNLSGAEFTDETRHQVFVTSGIFRKVDYGFQYGVVLDSLHDDWYFRGDSVQLRSELSWRCEGCNVYGFQFMVGVDDDTSNTNVVDEVITFEPTDQYRLFYRRLLKQSGQWDAFGGWTDRDDGLLGANLSLPLHRCLVLATGATYLIPSEGNSNGGNEQEGWNISLGLVYRPGGPKGPGWYSRPMFDVADNGTFMIDRL